MLVDSAIHGMSSLRGRFESWIDNTCARMAWGMRTSVRWSANRLQRACPEPSANEARMVKMSFETTSSLQPSHPANRWDSCPSGLSSFCRWGPLHELCLLQRARRIASWLQMVQNGRSRHCWRYLGPPTSMECTGSLLAADS